MVINLTSEKLKSIQIKIKTGSYEKVDTLAKVLKEKYKVNVSKNELLGSLAEEALETATFNLNGQTLTTKEILENTNIPEETTIEKEDNISQESISNKESDMKE